MKVLSVDEVAAWLKSRGLEFQGAELRDSEYLKLPEGENRTVSHIDWNPRNQMLLAFELTKWFSAAEACMWMSKWNGTEAWKHELFLGLRERRGYSGSLLDYPGQIFHAEVPGDVELMGSYILMMMAFNWECYLVNHDASKIIWLADEILDIYTRDLDDQASWRGRLEYTLNIDCCGSEERDVAEA